MITFRLNDSLPASVVEEWKEMLLPQDSYDSPSCDDDKTRKLLRLIDKYEDAGYGSCILKDEKVAEIVRRALFFHNKERYRLLAWCIMPNHVHVLIELISDTPLSVIIHSWRSFTSNEINKVSGRTGPIWMPEYFDRYIRDFNHFNSVVRYIHYNPVKAGLCTEASHYRWSSAYSAETP